MILGPILPAGHAVAQQQTLKEQSVGAWVLDGAYEQAKDGEKTESWGPNVKGTVMFGPSGRSGFSMRGCPEQVRE
jgi:hypothetical protein